MSDCSVSHPRLKTVAWVGVKSKIASIDVAVSRLKRSSGFKQTDLAESNHSSQFHRFTFSHLNVNLHPVNFLTGFAGGDVWLQDDALSLQCRVMTHLW